MIEYMGRATPSKKAREGQKQAVSRPFGGMSVQDYLNEKIDAYKRSCYLEDLTSLRVACIDLCRTIRKEVGLRMTYRAAKRLLQEA